MFLNQILEEYQESDNDKDKDELFKQFTDRLWKSKYVFKKYKKYYTYEVNESLLGDNQELISIFNQYSEVEYTVCKSFYKKRLDFIDYIRIRVNNIYGVYFDEDVYYQKEYYRLLRTPKTEYYKAVQILKDGGNASYEEIRLKINESFAQVETTRLFSIEKKKKLKWTAYKKLINKFLLKIFSNYIPIHEYEERHGWDMRVNTDGWSENNYIIRYFSKSLTGYIINFIRDSKPKEVKQKKCLKCNIDIINTNNSRKYCEGCAKKVKKIQNKIYYHSGK